MSRNRCPSCICEYDGENERMWVPTVSAVKNMQVYTLQKTLTWLGLKYIYSGNQEPTISWDLSGICHSVRNSLVNAIKKQRHNFHILEQDETDESSGC
jgi:hypothetical protein